MRKVAMLVAAAALVGCTARTNMSGTDMSASAGVPTELSTAYPGLARGWVALNAEAIRPYYAENAVIVLPQTQFNGWNDMHTRWLAPNLSNMRNFSTSGVTFTREGNDIIETGRYSYSVLQGGSSEKRQGAFANRWQRQPDGSWRVVSATIQ